MPSEDDISAYLDGTLPDDKRKALEEAFDADPDLVRRMLDQQKIDAGLRALLGRDSEALEMAILASTRGLSNESLVRRTMETVSGQSARGTVVDFAGRRSRFRKWFPALAAAAAAVLMVLFFWKWPRSTVTIAVLRSQAGAQWEGKVSPGAAGAKLGRGPWRLVSGVAELEFPNGALATLEGPADFELVSVGRLDLRAGRMIAEVPPTARGFTVVTPAGEVVDSGSRFGVNVSNGGFTEAHVFEGRVLVKPERSFHSRGQELSRRMALALDPGNRSVSSIQVDDSVFPSAGRTHDDLLVGGECEPGMSFGIRGFPGRPGIWGGDLVEVRRGWEEVSPHSGSGMLRFISTASLLGKRDETLSSEQWQIVDLRSFRDEISTGGVVAEASMWVNRSGENMGPCSLTLMAFDGSPHDVKSIVPRDTPPLLGEKREGMTPDNDPATWQEIRITMNLPAGTTSLVMNPRAFLGKNEDATTGYFADSLSLRVIVPPRGGKGR